MKKKLSNLIVLSAIALAVNPAYADTSCQDIANYTPFTAALVPTACVGIESILQSSGRFQSVNYGINNIHLCYASQAPISVTLGGNQVTITTISSWTDNSDVFGTPFIPPFNGTSSIGTVATQLTVRNDHNIAIENIYTRDTINLMNGWEEDIIVGVALLPSNVSINVVGDIKVESYPQNNGSVLIADLKGRICRVVNK
jgi:hypothetical protein